MLEIRCAHARRRTDLGDEALLRGIRRNDPKLVVGSLGEMVLTWKTGPATQLIFHHAKHGRYMVTHVDAEGLGRTAMADGDPAEQVTIGVGGEPETRPGDHFIEPVFAVALAERFMLDGGRDPCVEWRPSTAHL